MATKITKAFLQEHFRKHDSITLYKTDGTPVTFAKHHLCLKPVINIG